MKTARILSTAALCATLLTLTAGCGGTSRVIWSEFRSVDPAGWRSLPAVVFQPNSAVAPGKTADVVICLRYRAGQTPKWIDINATQDWLEADSPVSHSRRIFLYNPDGSPAGRGSHGVIEVYDTLCRHLTIPEQWSLEIAPAGRTPKGIINAGVILAEP